MSVPAAAVTARAPMSIRTRGLLLYAVMALLILGVGLLQSWIVALTILNLCLISAVMSLGVNMQWGYAGLFNAGVMGFAALGGIGVVLTSMPPVGGALGAGGWNLGLAAAAIVLTLAAALFVRGRAPDYLRAPATLLTILVGYFGWQPEGLLQVLGTDYKFAVSFIILVVVLLIRPTGIFRGRVI